MVTTKNLRTTSLVIAFAVLAIYVIGSGIWVNTGDNWYQSLNSPSWQPPDFVFGLIWPYNFFVIGTCIYSNWQNMSDRTWFVWLAMLALSVVMALIWAYQFYRPHNFMAAAIALSLAALITLPLTILNFSNSFAIGIAFLPYQIWVILASTLSWGYFALNKSN